MFRRNIGFALDDIDGQVNTERPVSVNKRSLQDMSLPDKIDSKSKLKSASLSVFSTVQVLPRDVISCASTKSLIRVI